MVVRQILVGVRMVPGISPVDVEMAVGVGMGMGVDQVPVAMGMGVGVLMLVGVLQFHRIPGHQHRTEGHDGPVSYTHLDVYKRQVSARGKKGPKKGCDGLNWAIGGKGAVLTGSKPKSQRLKIGF